MERICYIPVLPLPPPCHPLAPSVPRLKSKLPTVMVKSTCASSSGLAPLKRQNAFWDSVEHRFFSAERLQREAVTGKEKVY